MIAENLEGCYILVNSGACFETLFKHDFRDEHYLGEGLDELPIREFVDMDIEVIKDWALKNIENPPEGYERNQFILSAEQIDEYDEQKFISINVPRLTEKCTTSAFLVLANHLGLLNYTRIQMIITHHPLVDEREAILWKSRTFCQAPVHTQLKYINRQMRDKTSNDEITLEQICLDEIERLTGKLPKSKDWKKIKRQFNALQQDKQHIDKLLNKQKGRRPRKQNYLLAHFLIKN